MVICKKCRKYVRYCQESCRITLNDISCKTYCVLLYLIVYSIDSVKFLWHNNVFYNSDVRIVG